MGERRTAGLFRNVDDSESRRWGPSVAVAVAVYFAVGAVLVSLAPTKTIQLANKAVDVTFVQTVMKPAPPPTPPPPVDVPEPPAAAAPVPRPEQKVVHLEKRPPVKKFVAPKEMPKEVPREADPSEDKGVAMVGDDAKPDPAGLEGGVARGGVVAGTAGGAVDLPDEAIPPKPLGTNRIPTYPQQARADGRTGAVVLQIVVLADGSVGDVKVVRGDEPFASAAVETVKAWKYEPARYKGLPISVYRTFQVTFRLTG